MKAAYTRSTRAIAPFTRRLSRVRGGYLPVRSVATVDASVSQSGGKVWVARAAQSLTRPLPVGEPPSHPTFESEASETVPRMAVAELPSGRVLGPHRAVIDRTGAMIEEFSTYWATSRWLEHPIFWHPFPKPPVVATGSLGVLAARGDHSYYHFLLDVLPRLAVLDLPGVPMPDRWYVPLQRLFQRQILELVGFLPEAEVIDSDLSQHVQAEMLLVPGLPDTELRTPPWTVAFIRERLRPASIDRIAGRRIYVTRGSERNSRRVANERDVVEMLTDRGFTVIDPGAMPVVDQIQTFAEAEWIVAPHGAALANLAFASPGASVIELFAPDYVQGCYWKLANCVPGLGYRYLVGVGRAPRRGARTGVMSDITVDPTVLARALDALPIELPPALAKTHH